MKGSDKYWSSTGDKGCLLSLDPGRSSLLPKLRFAMKIPKRADVWICPLGIYLTVSVCVWVRMCVTCSRVKVLSGRVLSCPYLWVLFCGGLVLIS